MQPCTKEKTIDKIQSDLDESAKLEIVKESRMSRLEEKTDNIEKKIDNLDSKIDGFFKVIECKADKSEVTEAKNQVKEVRTSIDGLKNGALLQLLGLIIALILAGIAIKK